MSKLIPGNPKHITLNERLYIEHFLNEGSSLKDIARFLCKAPTPSPRRSNSIGFRTPGTKAISILLITSVSIGSAAKRQMHVKRLSSVIRCADPASNAIRSVPDSSGNPVLLQKKEKPLYHNNEI